jgi:hypothetical protein
MKKENFGLKLRIYHLEEVLKRKYGDSDKGWRVVSGSRWCVLNRAYLATWRRASNGLLNGTVLIPCRVVFEAVFSYS